jgi:hypothetical protein
LYRFIWDIIDNLAFYGVGGIPLDWALAGDELERAILSVVDLFSALTLLYIYHKIGQKRL